MSTVAGAAYRGGKYYLQNRKNFTWKTHGRKLAVETGKGAVRGLVNATVYRYIGAGSSLRFGKRIVQGRIIQQTRRIDHTVSHSAKRGGIKHLRHIYKTNKLVKYRRR